MRIEDGSKLDFQDVLLCPKRSTLESRKDADLEREISFKHSGRTWRGVPIVAANLDTVGTFSMCNVLSRFKMLTAIHKFYSIEDWKKNYHSSYKDYIIPTIGIKDDDFDTFLKIYSLYSADSIRFVCIDIANGYTERFASFVSKIRNRFPALTIIAGNVVTGEMTEQLILSGADIVKVGIGSGCFVPGTRINTINGSRNIEDIKIDDEIYTHTGSLKKVIDTLKYTEDEKIISVNGIKSTSHHEYYVIDKKNKNIVTEENIHKYAEWIPAEKLNKDIHLLIKLAR